MLLVSIAVLTEVHTKTTQSLWCYNDDFDECRAVEEYPELGLNRLDNNDWEDVLNGKKVKC